MSLPLDFHPAVRDELAAAEQWYDQQRPGLGADFVAAAGQMFADIAASPARYGFAGGDVRAGTITPFAYVVYYRALPDRVRVLAVSHAARHPRHWQRRV